MKELIRGIARKTWMPARRLLAVRGSVQLGRDVHLGAGSRVESHHGLTIGDSVYVGKYCTIEVDGEIGRGVLIGNNVGLVGRHDHDHRQIGALIRYAPWIGSPGYTGPGLLSKLIIESDVWIGYGAIVLSGVHIGRGAIVAAGALVLSDVAPYAVVAGNPARAVGARFTEDEVLEHERFLYGGESVGPGE